MCGDEEKDKGKDRGRHKDKFPHEEVKTTNLRSLRILREWREGVRLRWSPRGLLSLRIFSEISEVVFHPALILHYSQK